MALRRAGCAMRQWAVRFELIYLPAHQPPPQRESARSDIFVASFFQFWGRGRSLAYTGWIMMRRWLMCRCID